MGKWLGDFVSLLPEKVAPDSDFETFLLGRGVSDSQLARYSIRGFSPRDITLPDKPPPEFLKTYRLLSPDSEYIAFPLTNVVGDYVGIQFRDIAKKSYMTYREAVHPELFGYRQAVIRNTDYLVLVEGVFDLFPLDRLGVPVVATLTAGLSPVVARSISRLFSHIFLLFDSDAAGKNATAKATPVFESLGLKVTCLKQAQGFKDTGDLWKSGGDAVVADLLSSQGVVQSK